MTGLDKITSQIQEEAEASAKERIEAAQKEAEQILADAKAACGRRQDRTRPRYLAFIGSEVP